MQCVGTADVTKARDTKRLPQVLYKGILDKQLALQAEVRSPGCAG